MEAEYSNIGPFGCRGTVEISRDGSSVRRSDDYYVLCHFSRYIKRGARRILVNRQAVPQNFGVTAFENPDGTKAVIISNHDRHDSGLTLEIDGTFIPVWVLRESISTILL